MRRPFVITLIAVVALAVASGARAEKRVALVIGNSAYTNSPLKNPKNDATLMADTLQDVGFKVTRLFDADQRTMKRAVIDFGRKLRRSDSVGLFYYAGHGVQVDGENFLIPIGALFGDELEIGIEAVSVNEFLRTMKRASSRINIVVLDACRNNPFARSFRSNVRGLARVDAPKGTYVAYATSPGAVALDGNTGHSPYTTALAKAILMPGASIEQVFKQARRDVLALTSERQTPWETSSITGRFYFVPPAEQAEAPSPPSSKGNTAVELAYWDTIKSSDNPALLRSYLRQYPSGVFADLAKIMIEQLETASKQEDTNRSRTPAATQSNNTEHELVYWNTVKDSDDAALLNSYLQRFPNGVFADLARVMIAKLERAQKNSPPKGQQPPEPMANPEQKAEPQMAESDQPPPSRKSEVEVAALEPEPVMPPASTENAADSDLPRKIQAALSAAGCSPGKVDGVWGRKSSAALSLFARHADVTLPSEEVSEATLRLFEGHAGRVCPLICGRGQVKQGGRCVARASPARNPAQKTATPNRQKPRKKKIRCASYGCEDIEDTQTINTQRRTAPAKRKTVCHSYGCDDADLGW